MTYPGPDPWPTPWPRPPKGSPTVERRAVAERLALLLASNPHITLIGALEQAFDAGQEYEQRRFVERLAEGAS